MRLHKAVLQALRKDAGLAVTQGWRVVPVDPHALLTLLDSYEPPPPTDQTATIESLRRQLRDQTALHRQAQKDGQRRFADGVAEGRRLERDRLSRPEGGV